MLSKGEQLERELAESRRRRAAAKSGVASLTRDIERIDINQSQGSASAPPPPRSSSVHRSSAHDAVSSIPPHLERQAAGLRAVQYAFAQPWTASDPSYDNIQGGMDRLFSVGGRGKPPSANDANKACDALEARLDRLEDDIELVEEFEREHGLDNTGKLRLGEYATREELEVQQLTQFVTQRTAEADRVTWLLERASPDGKGGARIRPCPPHLEEEFEKSLHAKGLGALGRRMEC